MSECSFSTNYRFSWQCSQPVCSLILTGGSIIFFLYQPVYTKPFPFLNLEWPWSQEVPDTHQGGTILLLHRWHQSSRTQRSISFKGTTSPSSAAQRKERMRYSESIRKSRMQQCCGSLLVLQAFWPCCHKPLSRKTLPRPPRGNLWGMVSP